MASLSSMAPMAVVFLAVVLASIDTTGAQIGVCYGMLGDPLPPPSEVIQLYNEKNIRRMRLYDPNADALRALMGTQIELILDVPNTELGSVASSQGNADTWVQNNVVAYGDVRFKYIAVGNEVEPSSPEAQSLVRAIQNIQTAINSVGLGSRVKVSTAFKYSFMDKTFPPRDGSFKAEYTGLLGPILDSLAANQAPVLLNLYPYFSHRDNPTDVPLDYALFKAPADPSSEYKTLFDAMLDATYYALEKAGKGDLNIVVSESGWPTEGGNAATVDNAMSYNNNLVQHVKGGTPKRPNGPIETYIFAMFDEGNKKGEETERHFGLFSQKNAKYPMSFE
ncbi:Glucan endo-1,3-beta-glucosidase, basic isoform [Linum perenne]